ncbi:MAG: hypothetical protein WBN22_14770, partial [Verrucomicrobiia bacterium]
IPLVVVNRFNNLADAWRIRICSFTESHNCSIQQVVRFSIYQQPTAMRLSVLTMIQNLIIIIPFEARLLWLCLYLTLGGTILHCGYERKSIKHHG